MTKSKKKTGTTNPLEALEADGSLVTLSQSSAMDVERIPTGILALDEALNGGIVRGSVVEAYGNPAGGKSALAMMLSGQAQKYGKVAYLDLENTLDPIKAENCDINIDELYIGQPASTEDTFTLLHKLVAIEDISLVVVDSVAAMVPLAEIHGDMADSHMMVQARLMSQGLRMLNQIMTEKDSRAIVMFINQVRATISPGGFGPSTTTTGGRALPFYSSVRLDVARIASVKRGEDIVGQEIKVKVQKNKYSPPFRQAVFKLDYETGVMNEVTLIEWALAAGLLVKSGAWFADPVSGETLAQGERKMTEYLKANPAFYQDLVSQLLSPDDDLVLNEDDVT